MNNRYREELLRFLRVPEGPSTGPSVEDDRDVRYGAPQRFNPLNMQHNRGWIPCPANWMYRP